MTINPILKIIRAKKLGILIRDAREKSGKSIDECAASMGISADELTKIESGDRPPTLPELEILSLRLDVPLEHFWENEVLKSDDRIGGIDLGEIKLSRQKAIGDLINQTRVSAGLSDEDLAQKAGITLQNIQLYENGEVSIPLPELEVLSQVLNNSITDFEDHQGPVGSLFAEKRNINEFLSLPSELQAFVGKSINRPYLELAVRLSEMKVEKLRALAESLLEITL